MEFLWQFIIEVYGKEVSVTVLVNGLFFVTFLYCTCSTKMFSVDLMKCIGTTVEKKIKYKMINQAKLFKEIVQSADQLTWVKDELCKIIYGRETKASQLKVMKYATTAVSKTMSAESAFDNNTTARVFALAYDTVAAEILQKNQDILMLFYLTHVMGA